MLIKRTSCLNYKITPGVFTEFNSCALDYMVSNYSVNLVKPPGDQNKVRLYGGYIRNGVPSFADATYLWTLNGVQYTGQDILINTLASTTYTAELSIIHNDGIVLKSKFFFRVAADNLTLEWFFFPFIVIPVSSPDCSNCIQYNKDTGTGSVATTATSWTFSDGSTSTSPVPPVQTETPDVEHITTVTLDSAEAPASGFDQAYVKLSGCEGTSTGGAPGTVLTYEVLDTQNNSLETGTVTVGSDVDIDIPEEGVYIVRMNGEVDLYIVDYCKLTACIKKLILRIFCPDDKGCCDGCDDESIQLARNEINRLIAGYGMHLIEVFNERVSDIGFLEVDDCRLKNFRIINKFITDLRSIRDRCGDGCEPTATEEECPSC